MTCGSNAGEAIIANLIVGLSIAGITEGHQITEDILEWYSKASMPIFVLKSECFSLPEMYTYYGTEEKCRQFFRVYQSRLP